MKSFGRRLLLGIVLLALLVALVFAMAPAHPVALVRVVDEGGAPVVAAVVHSEGLRTKPGPYVGGWYGWQAATNGGVPNPPVTTDKDGFARLPYPKYVFERIETGTLCLSVHHPDYVSDRPERVVATAPPAGAPWRVYLNYLKDRFVRKTLVARPNSVVLKHGATLVLRVEGTDTGGRLLGQVSGSMYSATNFWTQPQPGMVMTRRLGSGSRTVRAVQLGSDGTVWFSDLVTLTAVAKQTNELTLTLKRGATVKGTLDPSVPRPVKNGRVVAHVWPVGCKPQDFPPQWHGWAAVGDNGTFNVPSLPEGELEIVALCDGFISTNGPGQIQSRYPQKHRIGANDANDLEIVVGMEPTARLEVQVLDELGKPLKGVRVQASPNARYGDWGSVLLMSDCYNMEDVLFRAGPFRGRDVWDYQGVSDDTGLAVLPNVPATERSLATEHARFDLPARGIAGGGKHRSTSIQLIAGQTNRTSIQLEPRGKSPIAHYE